VTKETYEDDELWAALEKQKQLGKIRAIGVSIGHNVMPLGRASVQTVQVHYNRLDRGAEEQLFPVCLKKNMGVLARVPLASGFLSGKYRPGQKWQQGDVRHGIADSKIDSTLHEVARIQREEVPPGIPLSTWALCWCLAHPAVTSVIPGCKSVEQLKSNAAAVELKVEEAVSRQPIGELD